MTMQWVKEDWKTRKTKENVIYYDWWKDPSRKNVISLLASQPEANWISLIFIKSLTITHLMFDQGFEVGSAHLNVKP